VRDATEFGPIAPQAPGLVELALAGEPTSQSEDCLNLNVWTPGLDDARRPVMVWIHGGSFLSGSGSGLLYRGGLLAAEQDVVVVTINYRLGLLGFLAHPSLLDDGQPWLDGRPWTGTGNWGLADQVAALWWVQENVASFGGDPDNVTLFGESAGGMSVATLLAVSEARGTFRRCIVQSGPPYTHPLDSAVATSERIADHLGVRGVRSELEHVPVSDLVIGFGDFAASRVDRDDSGLLLRPVVGDGLLAEEPEEAVAAGAAADRPLLIGTTRDESSFFTVGDDRLRNLDDAGLRHWLRRLSKDPEAVEQLVDTVRSARRSRGEGTSPRELWVAIASDWVFRLPSVRLADRHAAAAVPGVPTYGYLFTWESPAFGGSLGSCHALDLPFVFGSVHRPAVQPFSGAGDEAFALSAAMRASWGAFARHGDPDAGDRPPLSGDGPVASRAVSTPWNGAHPWSRWDLAGRPTTVLGPWPADEQLIRVVDDPRGEELDAVARTVGLVGSKVDGS
jgi:para-nitrobenzyl esterase